MDLMIRVTGVASIYRLPQLNNLVCSWLNGVTFQDSSRRQSPEMDQPEDEPNPSRGQRGSKKQDNYIIAVKVAMFSYRLFSQTSHLFLHLHLARLEYFFATIFPTTLCRNREHSVFKS